MKNDDDILETIILELITPQKLQNKKLKCRNLDTISDLIKRGQKLFNFCLMLII